MLYFSLSVSVKTEPKLRYFGFGRSLFNTQKSTHVKSIFLKLKVETLSFHFAETTNTQAYGTPRNIRAVVLKLGVATQLCVADIFKGVAKKS
jgi:hypothetical protein